MCIMYFIFIFELTADITKYSGEKFLVFVTTIMMITTIIAIMFFYI